MTAGRAGQDVIIPSRYTGGRRHLQDSQEIQRRLRRDFERAADDVSRNADLT